MDVSVDTFHGLLNQSVGGVVWVDHWGQVGHSNELLEAFDEEGVELRVDVGSCKLVFALC